MITEEFAEQLYEKIGEANNEFDSKELEMLSTMLRSEIMIKALGRVLFYASLKNNEMIQLDMADPKQVVFFTRMQGRSQGAIEVISGLLGLITIPQEEEEDDSAATQLN